MAAAAIAGDLDGNKLNPAPVREKSHQCFGFDLEMFRFERQSRPGLQMDETKAALRVRQISAGAS